MAKVIYSSGNPPPKRGLDCSGDVSSVQQHFREACDVNQVMSRFVRTGSVATGLPISMGAARPIYGDFVGLDDFMHCQNRIIAAQTAFDALPSRVRSRFQNDPRQLVAFFADEDNLEEAISLGLVKRPLRVSKPVDDADGAAPASDPPVAAPVPPKARKKGGVAESDV